ncbi:unnamed protein product [marine sediment metagenome]|uniref:Uncharacterized protein n=1 Tax=marine sediment metagenome TaxID=412755 RepID=X1HNW7_9ZZZZ
MLSVFGNFQKLAKIQDAIAEKISFYQVPYYTLDLREKEGVM